MDDSDGDGVCDGSDLCLGNDFSGDTDGDLYCDNIDDDDDGDGCLDGVDAQPTLTSADPDNDGLGNDCDLCFGLDTSGDNDSDGTCDNLDADDDNDGCPDAQDPAPMVYSPDPDEDGVATDCDICLSPIPMTA